MQNLKRNILIADDHSLIRNGVRLILEDMDLDFNTYFAATLSQISAVCSEHALDLAVIDAHFPDGDSLKIIPDLKTAQPNLKILIYSGIDENLHALKYLKSGADGFISKLSDEDEIQKAILAVLENGKYLSIAVQDILLTSLHNPASYNPLSALTAREMEIARMYAAGLGNLEIAAALEIKQNTVSTIKKRIYEKLEIDNLVDLIAKLKEGENQIL